MSTFLTDLDAYFERIGHSYERAPTLEILQRLHALHTETIAFENLSPFLGQGVYLDARLLIAGKTCQSWTRGLLLRTEFAVLARVDGAWVSGERAGSASSLVPVNDAN